MMVALGINLDCHDHQEQQAVGEAPSRVTVTHAVQGRLALSLKADGVLAEEFGKEPSRHSRERAMRRSAEIGSAAMARFYGATLRYVELGSVPATAGGGGAAACEPNTDDRFLQRVQELAAATIEASTTPAEAAIAAKLLPIVEAYRRELLVAGNECHLLADGSIATLKLAEFGGQVDAAEQELAVRRLVELTDTGMFLPTGHDSAADVYVALAQYFASTRRDFVSALVAAELAIQRAAGQPGSISAEYSQQLTEWRDGVRAKAEPQRASERGR